MSLEFAVEDFQSYLLDAAPLWKEHYEEVTLNSLRGKREFAPAIDKYLFHEREGNLFVFTAREEDTGELKGYAVFVCNIFMHYRHNIVAFNDALYFHPSVRKGFSAIKFMKWCEKQLGELSQGRIEIVQWRSKNEHDFSKILVKMGYSQEDTIYNKWIGK